MDAKAIERHGRDLSKAASTNSQDPGTCATIITLLNELKNGVRASEELLRSTKIGIIVNKLKQHKDPSVTRMANELVNKWKGDVGKKDPRAAGTASPRGLNGGVKMEKGGSGTGMAIDGAPEKSKVPPEKRSATTDGVDCAKTGDKVRDSCISLIYNGLSFMSEERKLPSMSFSMNNTLSIDTGIPAPSYILQKSRAVEEAAYKHYHPNADSDTQPSDPYRQKMRSLFQNLKAKSNPHLRVRVLSGEIPPVQFVKMTTEELKSPERVAQDAALQKENLHDAMVAQEERSISSSLQCGKCKERKVSYTQAQTRSADEPMTTFCTCTICGHKWKFC